MGQNPQAIVLMHYLNHRGERCLRRIEPLQLWFGTTQWHTQPQFFLKAFDHDKQEWRDFALAMFSH